MSQTVENKLVRAESWLRPYRVYGEDKIVGNVFVYNDEGIVYQTVQGWFEAHGKSKGSLVGDVVEVELGELRKARKIDFAKKDNFYVTTYKGQYDHEYKIAVYIYAGDKVSISPAKEIAVSIDDIETNYKYEHTIKGLPCVDASGNKSDTLIVQSRCYHRTEYTPKGEKRNTLIADFKEVGVELGYYDAEKILEKFNITKK